MREIPGRWLPPLIWMGLIFAMSAQPSPPQLPEPLLDLLLKKAGHMVGYAVLAWLYLRALRGCGSTFNRAYLFSLALSVAYAVTDELHQAFVPGRHASAVDVCIDGLGATLALALAWRRAKAQAPGPQ